MKELLRHGNATAVWEGYCGMGLLLRYGNATAGWEGYCGMGYPYLLVPRCLQVGSNRAA
jgi:hypothetical protein